MSQEAIKIPFKHTLIFIAIAAFLVSFFGSRLFAAVCPTCVDSRERYSLPPFLVRDRNGCTDRLARDSGQENRQARPGLCTCLWPCLGLIGDEVGLLPTFGNYYSELTYQIFVGAVGLIILGALAIRFGRDCEEISCAWNDGGSGPRWALSSRVLNPLFRFRSGHYRSIFRFARVPSNCLGLPASARDVCSDYEGLSPSESWLGLVTAALQ